MISSWDNTKHTQLDFSVSISHLLFSCTSWSHFSVYCWLVCSTQPDQVHWLIWLLDSYHRRNKLIWLIKFLFVCKTVLDNVIKVWKENSYPKGHWAENGYPKGHWAEEATPSECSTLLRLNPPWEGSGRQHYQQLTACSTYVTPEWSKQGSFLLQ